MAEQLTQVALGIIRNDDHILLIERQKKDIGTNGDVLNWAFPGGKMEGNETPEQTVRREVEEETGVLVR